MPHSKPKRDLASLVKERPFREFSQWWKMGDEFIQFMSDAIVSKWTELGETKVGMERIQNNLDEYLGLVYGQTTHPDRLKNFFEKDFSTLFYSGEFDAISYALYRSSYETIAKEHIGIGTAITEQRRGFTKEVGKVFFFIFKGATSIRFTFRIENSATISGTSKKY